MKKLVFGITGASGMPYAKSILEKLSRMEVEVFLIASKNGRQIFKEETDEEISDFVKQFRNITLEDENNFFSPVASGGNDFDVLICPASMGFLGRFASGISGNLLERAADVALKERRKILLAVRESPYNLIHLENMLKIAKAGGIIMPLSPFFYLKPVGIKELVDSFSDRILKLVFEDYEPVHRWGLKDG